MKKFEKRNFVSGSGAQGRFGAEDAATSPEDSSKPQPK
jgi:hypothetical protein